MNNLVSKFEKVVVKAIAKLPPEDIQYCEEQTALYQKTATQLERWLQFHLSAVEMYEGESYHLKPYYGKDRPELTVSSEYEDKSYGKYEFVPHFGIPVIHKLQKKIKAKFVVDIFNYFDKKYVLTLKRDFVVSGYSSRGDDYYYDKMERYLDYNVIIEEMKEQLGGTLDFQEVAVNKAKQEFMGEVNARYGGGAELKGKQVTLNHYLRFDYSRDGYSFEHNCKQLRMLDNAISIFELEEVVTDLNLKELYGKLVDFTTDYALNASERIDSLRFYKNRKVIIKFKSMEDASAFCSLFELKGTT